ncbi:hypothetical protein CGRA01v4_13248 [Colletotrichum graminicola]|nr:hypothetical protein CGRA01v4_13248 [Colletotrichum graminicola]
MVAVTSITLSSGRTWPPPAEMAAVSPTATWLSKPSRRTLAPLTPCASRSTPPWPASRVVAGPGSSRTRPAVPSALSPARTRTLSPATSSLCWASTLGSTPTTCSTRTARPSTSTRFGTLSTGRLLPSALKNRQRLRMYDSLVNAHI